MKTRKSLAILCVMTLIFTAGTVRADVLSTNDFESGTMGGWSAIGADAGLYHFGDKVSNMTDADKLINYAPSGTNCLWDGRGGDYLQLQNPLPLASRGYTSVTISFKWVCRNAQSTRRLHTSYSADGGATWASLGYVAGATVAFASGSGTYTITTAGYSFTDQAKFQFAFADSGGAAGPFFVDDVVITATPNFVGAYWDLNGVDAGAGSTSPTGTWDAVTPNWNVLADGTGATNAWSAGVTAVFSAGTDATGAYTVTVDGTQAINGLVFEEGSVTLSGGGLQMTSDSGVYVPAAQTATVASAFSEDATARKLTKTGSGKLVLSGSNFGATGGMSLLFGVTQFESPSAINGTARNVTVTSPGIVVFGGSSFDIAAALSGRIVATSTGVIAADNYAGTDFNFSTAGAGLTAASLGAVGTVNYTGNYTPNGTTYRLGGGGGTLTLNSSLASANSLVVSGPGTVQLNGYSSTVTALSNTGIGAILENGNPIDMTLTVNNSAACTFAGIIRDGAGGGTLTLVKTNAGVLTLSGANDYNGGTVLIAGRIAMSADNNLGPTSNILTVNASAQLAPSATFSHPITINSGAILSVGGNALWTFTGDVTGEGGISASNFSFGSAFKLNGTGNTFQGPLYIGVGATQSAGTQFGVFVASLADSETANGVIEIGSRATYSGAGVGAGGAYFVWTGSTNLVLNNRQIVLATNTGGVPLIVNNGTGGSSLTINTDLGFDDLYQGAKPLGLGGTSTGTNTFAGKITDGTGSVVSLNKFGTCVWVLSGANTFSGTTTVSAGTLVLAAGTSLSDTNRLTIAGTGANKVHLNAGVKEKVGFLTLNATPSVPVTGTWGSSVSKAANTNDTYFSGTGVLYVGVDLPGDGTLIMLK